MVTYDIADDRRRQLVAKALAGYGARVQYRAILVSLRLALIDFIEDIEFFSLEGG